MFLDKDRLNKVAKLIRKTILKDDIPYKRSRFSFLCNVFSALTLGALLTINPIGAINTVCIIFLILSTLCAFVSGSLLFIKLNAVKQYSKILAIKYSLEYDDYDRLIEELEGALGIDRKDDMNEEIEYTKDGRPIIDVDFEEIPNSKTSEDYANFVPAVEPQIIDVDFTPVEEVPLEQNIAYLREYVNDVAYDGYENDLAIIDTMYDLVTSGTVTGPVLASIENSLHTLTEAIFLKACKHYDLPSTRKRTNPDA